MDESAVIERPAYHALTIRHDYQAAMDGHREEVDGEDGIAVAIAIAPLDGLYNFVMDGEVGREGRAHNADQCVHGIVVEGCNFHVVSIVKKDYFQSRLTLELAKNFSFALFKEVSFASNSSFEISTTPSRELRKFLFAPFSVVAKAWSLGKGLSPVPR